MWGKKEYGTEGATCTVGCTCKWWVGARSEKLRSITTDPVAIELADLMTLHGDILDDIE